jgi:hypothetical protein
MRFVITLLFATLLGCNYESIDEHPCPPGGTDLTYENFGKFYFNKYCNYCHSAQIDERQGAPQNYVFNSRAAIAQHRERVFARAAGENDSMPPGPDDPPDAEREKLADWLACGAK